MEAIEREIALHREHLAWHRNHNQATPTALGAAATHCQEVQLELLERKREALSREVEQSLLTFAPTKLSHPHINVSRPLPNIEDPSTWLKFTLPGSSKRR